MLYYLFKLWKAGRIDDYSIVFIKDIGEIRRIQLWNLDIYICFFDTDRICGIRFNTVKLFLII